VSPSTSSLAKPVVSPDAFVGAATTDARPAGILFGGEKSGLRNDIVAQCDAILTYPVNPGFASLNLAQAVAVFAHAWGAARGLEGKFATVHEGVDAPAGRDAIDAMFEHFEAELERSGFFFPPEKTELMRQNLRNALIRARWTEQEVRTFRGAIKALAIGRGKARILRDQDG